MLIERPGFIFRQLLSACQVARGLFSYDDHGFGVLIQDLCKYLGPTRSSPRRSYPDFGLLDDHRSEPAFPTDPSRNDSRHSPASAQGKFLFNVPSFRYGEYVSLVSALHRKRGGLAHFLRQGPITHTCNSEETCTNIHHICTHAATLPCVQKSVLGEDQTMGV